ncbi:MAG: discoidin domain-containing protein [Planctomycetaceae bacterium]
MPKLSLALLACTLLLSTACADDTPPPIRVLLVTGGCCHDYTIQKQLLSKGLEERAHVDVEVVQQGGTATNSKIELYERADWAEGFDIVIHDECFSDVKDIAWVDNILKPHREGLPGVVLHCAMHCYRDGREEWFNFCGVTSHRHGAHYPHEVLNRDAAHPIMREFGAGWANPAGELYWIEKLGEHAHPLASAKNREKGNEEVCVWTNQFGKARVFGTTLGHHNETVGSPEYLDLITRGVLWATNHLDDPRYLKKSSAGPKLVPKNLALGSKATASSEETGKNNFAPNAVDGNPQTRWCASDGSAPQWLHIDLGEPKNLKGASIKWESDNTVYKYILEGAISEGNWIPLVDESEKGRNGVHEFEFNAPDIQYVRVTFLGSNTGGWGSIWDLNLHGDEFVEVDPEKAAREAEAAVLADVGAPEGFDMTLFAKPPAVNYPVFVASAPDGTVYVSVDKNGSLDRDPNRGSIYRLRDLDGDGRADESKLFVANVDSPRGIVWDHDRLYVMHPPHLSAYIDHDGDGIADEEQVLVKDIAFGFADRPADHTSNGVTLGIDGWLYLAIGDFGFMQAEGADGTKLQFRSGGVVRVRPDGTGLEVYSRGTRNILEVAMDPLLNGFTRDNTNDGGGWDIRLHHFSGMEHHGYPSLFKNFPDEIVQPLADYGGGSGCGALYLDEPGFPDGFGNALYTADWGRSMVFRHNVTRSGGTFVADQNEFLKSTRVTDLDVDASSNLYVTSWKGATFTYAGEDVGYLIRLTPKGYKAPEMVDFSKLSRKELVEQLKSPSHRRRLEAQRTLLRTGIDAATEKSLQQLCLDESTVITSRVAALYALKQARGMSAQHFLTSVAVKSESMRPFAVRAIGDLKGVGAPWKVTASDALPLSNDPTSLSLDGLNSGLNSDDPRARLESIVAVSRLKLMNLADELATHLDDPDPIVAHTTARAMAHMGASDAAFAVVDNANASDLQRRNALQVLQSLHTEDVVNGLIQRLDREQNPARQLGLFTALCRLHYTDGEWKGNSWGTRPDTSGPYYQPATWEQSDAIKAALNRAMEQAKGSEAAPYVEQLSRHKVQLDGALDRLVAMALKDDKLKPLAVRELSQSRDIPEQASQILINVAASASSPDDLRSEAAQTLLRTNVDNAFDVAFTALADLAGKNENSDAVKQLWNRIKSAPQLGPSISLLTNSSASGDNPAGRWANAALLSITADSKASPEVREQAIKAIDANWKEPAGRISILKAARLTNFRHYEAQVLASLSDSDEGVRKLAQDIAKQWKLNEEPTPAGPTIAELKVEDVIEQVLKQSGDAGRGEYLFTSLNCAKCHTVKKGEPLRGPFLPQVVKTYKRNQLAEAVLLPSKTLAQGFVTEVFQIDDGKTYTGFITAESADEIVIRDGEAKEIRLDPEHIEGRRRQDKSMMPEGLVKDLTVTDFASLLDYLQSLKD